MICLKFKRLLSETSMVKKVFLVVSCFFVASQLFSESIPDSLLGIWEAKDRYVFFEQNNEEDPELVIVLKTYYGWYLDRAAEPASYEETESRTRNTATTRKPESIKLQKINTKTTQNSLYGSMNLVYSRSQFNTIPFFVLNDNMYLSYFEKDEPEDSVYSQNANWNFYRGIAPSKGFQVSPQTVPSNISGYIIDGTKLYDVRYWQSYMDYSKEYINFTYNEDSYMIPKHISSSNANYSCVTGQSKKVRNPVKPFEYKAENYLFNDDGSVFTKNEEPYMKHLVDKENFADLIAIVKEANARRKPDADPLFPESNLDWHWDLIDLLEKDNKLIQEVRERQKKFGLRGKDVGK